MRNFQNVTMNSGSIRSR